MNKKTRAAIALSVGAALAIGPALAAHAVGSTILNGSFEADAPGTTSITGWTSKNQLIDLGVTSIAGCTSVDTSDYSNLRDYADQVDDWWDYYSQQVPDQSTFYYVHDLLNDTPVLILGDRLVYDDLSGDFYLETTAVTPFPFSSTAAADFTLSSVEEPAAEPTPSDPTPPEPTPTEPTPPAPTPSTPTPSPSTPAPGDEIVPPGGSENTDTGPRPEPQLSPVDVAYTYVVEGDWSSAQQTAFAAAFATSMPDPTVRQDDPQWAELDEEEYSATVIDGFEVDREGNVLELFSDLSAELEGYVIHGPAVFSEPFTVGAGRQISFDWQAVNDSDDFHIFGYLLNTDTCQQIELVDATGEEQDWTTTSVAIPTPGTYRFVFVSGSYDQSWGSAAGALMYIDNIVQTANFDEPGVDLALAVGVGDYLPGSDVQVAGGNLNSVSAYDLVLRSTPVTVTEGVTDVEGNFLDVIALPANITPGPHTLTLTGQGPSGPLTDVGYITVGADGTLLYYSETGPQAALALTGAAENAGIIALALLLTLTGAAVFELDRRRRTPFSTVYVR